MMVEEFGGIVQEKVEGWTDEQNDEREAAFDSAMNALKQCEEKKTKSVIGRLNQVRDLTNYVKDSMGGPDGGVDVYPAIRDLLEKLEEIKGPVEDNWRPSYTGLHMVHCPVDGEMAWVSKEAVDEFKAKGMAAILKTS